MLLRVPMQWKAFWWRLAAPAILLLAGIAPAVQGLEVSRLHPRLFLRSDRAEIGRGLTVSQARQRRHHPELAEYAKLTGSRKNWEGILTPALRTLLAGDVAAQARARDWLLGQTRPRKRSSARQAGGHMAVAFDWLYGTLSGEERRAIAENVRNSASAALFFLRFGRPDINHNFTYMALFTVTMAGLALHGEPGFEADVETYLREAHSWLEGPGGVYEACAARGGAWPEGGQYSFTECTRLLVLTMHGLRTATDRDPFGIVHAQHDDFMRGTARFYMAMTRPDFTLERLGDMNRFKPLLRDQHRLVIEALADGLRFDGGHPRTPAMLEHFSDLLHEHYGWRDTHPNFRWGMILFADPDAPRDRDAFAAQPLGQVFGRGSLDLVVLRNGWHPDGTMITFQAGDHCVDHQHFDKGSFTIYHRGALAIDSGAYDRIYSTHHRQYATRTVAHNAPLVFDPERPVPPKHKRDGGQLVLRGLQHHARWSDYLAHRASEGLDAADLVRFQHGSAPALRAGGSGTPAALGAGAIGERTARREDTSPVRDPAARRADGVAPFASYAVAQAELSGAYGARTRSLLRTLAYWPAAQLVLVHDHFDLETPLDVAFLLHTQEPLRASGASGLEPGRLELGVVPWWVTTRSGSLDLGGHRVAYDGRLFMRTIDAERYVAYRIGGKGFEWFVSGRNYKPSSNARAPRESGAWRVEVHSSKPARRHTMTHVLQIGDASIFKMAEAAALHAGSAWQGAHVSSAPEVVLLVSSLPRGPLPVRYELDTALPCLHLIVGLEPRARVGVRSASSSLTLSVSDEGVLAFHDPTVGPHEISLAVVPD